MELTEQMESLDQKVAEDQEPRLREQGNQSLVKTSESLTEEDFEALEREIAGDEQPKEDLELYYWNTVADQVLKEKSEADKKEKRQRLKKILKVQAEMEEEKKDTLQESEQPMTVQDKLLKDGFKELHQRTRKIAKQQAKIEMEKKKIEKEKKAVQEEKGKHELVESFKEKLAEREIRRLKERLEREANEKMKAMEKEWKSIEEQKQMIKEERKAIEREKRMAEKELKKQQRKAEREKRKERIRRESEEPLKKEDIAEIVREELIRQMKTRTKPKPVKRQARSEGAKGLKSQLYSAFSKAKARCAEKASQIRDKADDSALLERLRNLCSRIWDSCKICEVFSRITSYFSDLMIRLEFRCKYAF